MSRCFLVSFGNLFAHMLQKNPKRVQICYYMDFYGAFWEPSRHLWETFGDQGAPKAPKSVPKATQWLQGYPQRVRKDDMTCLSR